jgi:hypothetical protein
VATTEATTGAELLDSIHAGGSDSVRLQKALISEWENLPLAGDTTTLQAAVPAAERTLTKA